MTALLRRPDLPPRWPPVVRNELERRHQVLARWCRGRVLDLSTPEGRAVVAGHAEPDGSYDTVLSVGGLVRFADLPAAVQRAVDLLGPSGTLLAAEPVARPGAPAVLAATAGALLPPVRGAHLHRDVPRVVRETGLVITDLERFTMPTLVWPLRPFVQFRALSIPGYHQ